MFENSEVIWITFANPKYPPRVTTADYSCVKVQNDGKICIYFRGEGPAYGCSKGSTGWEIY